MTDDEKRERHRLEEQKRRQRPEVREAQRQRAARYRADPEYRARAIARAKAWKEANPERARQKDAEANARRKARPEVKAKLRAAARGGRRGLTPEQIEALRTACKGACEVCGKTPPPTKNGSDGLHLDHRHDNGAIRGMLCANCNRDLAAVDRGPEHLARLIEYAKRGAE